MLTAIKTMPGILMSTPTDETAVRLTKPETFLMLFLGISVYAGHYVDFVFKAPVSYVVFIASLSGIGYLFRRNIVSNVAANSSQFKIACVALFLLLISLPFWTSLYNVTSYLGILFAFVIYNSNLRLFLRVTLLFLLLNFLVALYEFIHLVYLFEPVVLKGGKPFKITPDLIYIFRAKGLFNGPLTLGIMAFYVGLFYFRNAFVLLLCIAASFLASSRLGVFSIVVILIFSGCLQTLMHDKLKLALATLCFLVLGLFIAWHTNQKMKDRYLKVADFSSPTSNIGRKHHWQRAIRYYENFDFRHKIFGNNGYLFRQYHSGTESGWLSLLVENGMLGFLLYAAVMVALTIKVLKERQWTYLPLMALIVLNMAVATIHLSRVGNILLWLFLFKLFDLLRQPKNSLHFERAKSIADSC